MAKIKPFKAIRAHSDYASRIASLPYEAISEKEMRSFKNDEFNFIHITHAEIDLSENVNKFTQNVYDKAKENLIDFINRGILIYEDEPCYFIYSIKMDNEWQTGLLCGAAIEDYRKEKIKKHEFTKPEKVMDRLNHINTTKSQTGIVLLTYPQINAIDIVIKNWQNQHQPIYDFVDDNGTEHKIWKVDDYAKISIISTLFDQLVPYSYIIDGHHRLDASLKISDDMIDNGLSITGDESFHYCLSCIFPDSDFKILEYNRLVKDLNHLTEKEFLSAIENHFEVTKVSDIFYQPKKRHEFGMYLNKQWYQLNFKDSLNPKNKIGNLDVTILQKWIISEILEIHDPRTSKRLGYIGGNNHYQRLMDAVDSNEFAVGFSLFPVTIQEIYDIADANLVMPPKSTWIEPKLRDGLIIYPI